MRITRNEFMASAAAFAVSPMLVGDGRKVKTPLMLDTKRMAIWDGSGIRTTFFVKANLEVRCLVVPGCTDGADITARHRYLSSLGIPEQSVVDLKYYDYARSKYLALGMKDTMPPNR